MCIAGCTPDSGTSGGKGSSAPVGTITSTCPSQTPNISTVKGPQDKGCGGTDWRTKWSLPSPAGQDGWIIQEVKIDRDITRADGATIKKSYHYWEAWPVTKGQTITDYQASGKYPHDDFYYSGEMPGTKGTSSWTGNAKFYEGDLPADFKSNNPDTPAAGILRATDKKPDFWDASGIDHNLKAAWDCTTAPPTSSVSGKAGSATVDATR